MTMVDRPASTLATLQLTEKDLCLLVGLDPQREDTIRIGSQYRVWRQKERQPMTAEYLGFTEKLITIPQSTLIIDVLRIHGIRATDGDVQTGTYRSLVKGRAHQAAAGKRVTA